MTHPATLEVKDMATNYSSISSSLISHTYKHKQTTKRHHYHYQLLPIIGLGIDRFQEWMLQVRTECCRKGRKRYSLDLNAHKVSLIIVRNLFFQKYSRSLSKEFLCLSILNVLTFFVLFSYFFPFLHGMIFHNPILNTLSLHKDSRPSLNVQFQKISIPPTESTFVLDPNPWNFRNFPTQLRTPWKEYFPQKCRCTILLSER